MKVYESSIGELFPEVTADKCSITNAESLKTYFVVQASKSSLLTSNFTEVGAALALISFSAL